MVEPNSCYNCNAVYSNCLKFKDKDPDYVFPSEYLCGNCL